MKSTPTKAFLDTNVLCYFFNADDPNHQSARYIMRMAEARRIIAIVSVATIFDTLYILRKYKDIERKINTLLDILEVAETNKQSIRKAFNLGWKDTEDAFQYICANQCQADAIVTNNPKDFKASTIPVFTPQHFEKLLQV